MRFGLSFLPHRLRHFLTFAAVGLVGVVVQYSVLVALVQGLRVDPVTGSGFGFVCGGLVNYMLNRRITFRSRKRHTEAASKFFTVAGLGLVWNSLLMYLMVKELAFPYLLAQAITTGLLLLWHYSANSLWTFRERTS